MSVFKPYRFYSSEDLEHEANAILSCMQTTLKYAPEFSLDPSCVAEFLGLDIVWDRIPPDAQGKIAARILPLERLIEINEDISELRGGFGASTIAHEIGHWVLHINQDEVEGLTKQQELNLGFKETIKPFLCRSIGELRGIEWQAQCFASCLLMPRLVLEDKRRGRNLTRWQHLYAMADELGVTISNLTNRLQSLGWIYIPKQSKQIYLDRTVQSEQAGLFG